MESLVNKLNRVKSVFNVNEVINRNISIIDIKDYYKTNIIPYFLFHNKEDFVHNGITRGIEYSDHDVYEHPKIVEKYIKELGATKCLELATGKGASSLYLARLFPEVKFHAINLPDGQIEIAIRKAQSVSNFFPEEGDYHDLSNYRVNEFDIVFVFEALCHSNAKEKVAQQVHRVLKPGGLFIVIDGYLNKYTKDLNDEEFLAKQLSEKGMVVNSFEYYGDVKNEITNSGFQEVFEEDASSLILPSLYRFERLSCWILFRVPLLGKVIARLLPRDFVNNAITGYLLPNLIQSKVACYYITVFKKI